ncbi:hypothetical protein ACFYU5_03125 [Nocardia aobensis]|uniref:Uncharacterized protein n=1 Tax=Nocardia aobensis TaxID=257277 RepID=A0ABW6NW29_9NOCA
MARNGIPRAGAALGITVLGSVPAGASTGAMPATVSEQARSCVADALVAAACIADAVASRSADMKFAA